MIRAIIFDCFGVLYADGGLLYYSSRLANYDELQPRIRELDAQADGGWISEAEHDVQIAELTGIPHTEIVRNLRQKRARNTELMRYIATLRTGYKVGMLSNVSTGAMDRFFTQHERDTLFDAVVLSCDIHHVKPEPEMYEAIAARLGVAPQECIMVDDREVNCDGARAVGMHAVLYQTNAQVQREITEVLAANA